MFLHFLGKKNARKTLLKSFGGITLNNYLSFECIWHRKGRRDPTKGIDNVSWQTIDNALNWIAHVLRCCYDHAARHQQSCGKEIVQSKYHTVDDDVLCPQVGLQTPK